MFNTLIRKLDAAGGLTGEDHATLLSLSSQARPVTADQDLVVEGDRPENVHIVLDGLACRYKLMPDGKRQIMALLIPGDFCDLHVAILGEMDHSISTLAPSTIGVIPRSAILDLTARHPRITRALWWATLVDEGILREWLANMGQREADRRMAHLFCELLVRMQTVGLADGNGYPFQVTQTELGDILGLTSVHVNRTLQILREQDLIVLERRWLEIRDVDRLKALCGFDPNYLHLTPRQNGGAEFGRNSSNTNGQID